MRGAVIATTLVIAILIGVGAGYLAGTENQRIAASTATLISVMTTVIYVSTSTNGISSGSQACISNINSSSATEYALTLHQITIVPSFIQYSNGRCWAFEGTFTSNGPGYSNLTFMFDHFSNTILYPCGVLSFKIDARVFVVPSYSGGNITGISIEPENPNQGTSCGEGSEVAIQPVSFNLISWDSSKQNVSLTLFYFSPFNASMQTLQARVFNSTWSYLIPFSSVNSTKPLLEGSYATQSIVIPSSPLRPGLVYNLTSTGTYSNGTKVISNYKVELQT
jgi:hypothetical protein